MGKPILLRSILVALIALFGIGLQSANADSGSITLTIYKAGWIIGGSGGGGTLTFRGRSYQLGVGGIDYGLVFGGSKTVLRGRVRNIQRASDVLKRLRRGKRGACRRSRRSRDRAHQPEWRRSRALGPPGWADGECRSERASDHAEIVGHGLSLAAASSDVCNSHRSYFGEAVAASVTVAKSDAAINAPRLFTSRNRFCHPLCAGIGAFHRRYIRSFR